MDVIVFPELLLCFAPSSVVTPSLLAIIFECNVMSRLKLEDTVHSLQSPTTVDHGI